MKNGKRLAHYAWLGIHLTTKRNIRVQSRLSVI